MPRKRFPSPTVEDAEDEDNDSENDATSPSSRDDFTMPDTFIAPKEDIVAEGDEEEEETRERESDEGLTLEESSEFCTLS